MAGIGKRGRPKGSVQKIRLEALRAVAKRHGDLKLIAAKLGVSDDLLSKRIRSDKDVCAAYEGGLADGKFNALDALWFSIQEHWLTICTNPACLHIEDNPREYSSRCPVCNSWGVNEEGEKKVFPPQHERMRGDSKCLDLICKNFLGLTDKIEHSGNEDKPLAFVSLADFAIAASKAHDRKKQTQKE